MRPDARTILRGLLHDKTSNTFVQLFRYTIVGGLAFVVDFGSLFAFTEYLGIHYLVSAALAFILGLITNYLLSLMWVFNQRSLSSPLTEFLVFTAIGLIGLGMNELLIWSFTEVVGFHYLASKLFSTGIVYLWNFFARKFMLFSQPGVAPCQNKPPSSSEEDPQA